MTTLDDAALRARYAALMREDAAGAAHPADDAWTSFAEGTLDPEARARLADHLVTCAACADVYRVVAQLRDGAGTVAPELDLSRPHAARRPWMGLAAAAALVMAVSGAWWMTTRVPRPETAPPSQVQAEAQARVDAPPALAEPDRVARGAAGAAPEPRVWAALPLAPAVALPASLALVVRGGPTDSQAFLTAFGSAIAPYRDGRYDEAAVSLDAVTRSFPDVSEGWFYLGVARLLSDDAAGAVVPLERADASSVVGNEAAWLKAVALERAGRASDASAWLRTLCTGTRAVRQRACDAEGAAR